MVLTRLNITLVAIAVLMAGCSIDVNIGTERVEGSGTTERRSYDLDAFDRVDISSAFDVDLTVRPDGPQSVVVEVDDNLFPHLRIEVDGRTLEIGVRSGKSINTENGLRAEVVATALDTIRTSGASKVAGTASGEAVAEIDSSGASDVRISELDSPALTMAVSGASEIVLSGRAGSVDIDASGASNVDLRDLPIDSATVSLSGASEAVFGPAGSVDGRASGASTVRVDAGTAVDVDTSGGSEVETG